MGTKRPVSRICRVIYRVFARRQAAKINVVDVDLWIAALDGEIADISHTSTVLCDIDLQQHNCSMINSERVMLVLLPLPSMDHMHSQLLRLDHMSEDLLDMWSLS